MLLLKQSTAATLAVGPFVDSTDGVTPETALSLTQAETRLSKNGAAFAQKNEASTATHGEEGNYLVVLNTTDTDTLGRMRLSIYVSGALPVWTDCMVMPANVWDSLFGADKLEVDVMQFGGTNGTNSAGRPEVNTTHAAGTAWGSGAITAASIAADAITAAKIADGAIDAATFAASAINAAAIAADAITAAKIADGAIDAATFAAGAINAAAIAADAITDAKVAADVTIASVTGAVGSVTGAVGSVTGNVGGNVTGSVGSLAAQAKADVNAEVVDALNVDTYAEPGQEAPGATVSLVKKIGYLYKFLRNKKTQTSTTLSVFADDAATVDQKATISDDATTYTHGEIASGP